MALKPMSLTDYMMTTLLLAKSALDNDYADYSDNWPDVFAALMDSDYVLCRDFDEDDEEAESEAQILLSGIPDDALMRVTGLQEWAFQMIPAQEVDEEVRRFCLMAQESRLHRHWMSIR